MNLEEIIKISGLNPIRCPKKMLNGPCGGQLNGMCEVNSKVSCIWVDIYNKLRSESNEHILKAICDRSRP